MAKYYGTIGFVKSVESDTAVDVYEESVTEKQYSGDILQISFRSQSTDNVNDDIAISNRISILLDPFALENFQYIRYAEWMGIKWKVSSVDMEYPRLTLTLGGVYNGKE